MNKQFDEFKEEIRGFSIKKLPTLSGSTTIKISALVLLFAILIASISTCSHTKKLLEQSKKTMEIAITPENFEKFYDVNFYNSLIELDKGSYYWTDSDDLLRTNLVVEIEPKQIPGNFKLTSVKLRVHQRINSNRRQYFKNWEMEDSEYIDGSPSTGYFLYNDLEYDTIDFDTVYIDLPLSGSRVIEFPMINDDTDGDEYKYIIVYEILDTNGSYVPNGNEDTSTYAVN